MGATGANVGGLVSRLFSCSINSLKNSLSDSSMTKGLSSNPVVMFAESIVPSGTFRPSKTPSNRPFLRCLLVAAHPLGATIMVATTIAARRLRFDGCRFMVGCLLYSVVIFLMYSLISSIKLKGKILVFVQRNVLRTCCLAGLSGGGLDAIVQKRLSSTAIHKSVVVFAISRRQALAFW